MLSINLTHWTMKTPQNVLKLSNAWAMTQAESFLRLTKGPFIATQLNLTQLDVELSWVELRRYKRALTDCFSSARRH